MKKYYNDLNILRVFSCIIILFYHLSILKGGFLAVCIFFTLSGYLSCVSSFNKDKFNVLDYYKKRLLHIYLPLVVVVFISTFVISLIPSINYFNLKPEVTSILFGYNNFWQLSANLDYFTRSVDSPFMHLWYISILIQFDIIFPFIFMGLKKLGEKSKLIPTISLGLLSIIGAFCFYFYDGNIMVSYYHTLLRVFSIVFGVFLGFTEYYYGTLVSDDLKKNKYLIGSLYLAILMVLFIFIDASNLLFKSSIIISTLVAFRLISYATTDDTYKDNLFNRIIKNISNISYEVYLVQYPIIYIFQNIELNSFIKIPVIIILTFIISYIIHYALDYKKDKKVLRKITEVIVILITLGGLVFYIISEDHSKEMKELENQMNQNSQMMLDKQAEYASKMKQEEEDWETLINKLENDKESLHEVVRNLPIVGVGDSVMLGAVNNLYEKFPNSYFDAAISRTDYEAYKVLKGLIDQGMLGDIIVFNLGTNGECPQSCKNEYLSLIGDRTLFWVNATKPDYPIFNTRLIELANSHNNIHIIDWIGASKGHPEYFVSDGIHLTSSGRVAYTETVYTAIYDYYLNELNNKKEKLIKEHDDALKEKITFYGNDLLLNVFNYVKDNYPDANYRIDKTYNYDKLKNELNNSELTYKLFFIFDSSINMKENDFNELVKMLNDHELYIIYMDNYELDVDNTYNFKEITNEHSDYLMVDKRHLTENGNVALSEMISNILDKKDSNE